MRLELLTAPQALPVSLDEAKLAAAIDGSAHDTHLTNVWIPAATAQAEHRMGGRAIISQQWLARLNGFPSAICITRSPLISVDEIKYVDPDGNELIMNPTDYELVGGDLDGLICPAPGISWPATINRPDAVRVKFTAGFGATSAAVPTSIRQWILMAVATWYRHREGLTETTGIADLPRDFCAALLDAYTIHRI